MANESKSAVFVDFLCWESALHIIRRAKSSPIEKIHYISVARSFRGFIPWLERRTGAPCLCCDQYVEAEIKWHGMSLYEAIQRRLTEILQTWSDEPAIQRFIQGLCSAQGFNPEKFREHLKEAAYPHIFKAVEMSVLTEYLCGRENCILLIRRTPFKRLFKHFLGARQLNFYRTFFSHRLRIDVRENYYYDKHCNKFYFNDRFGSAGHFAGQWFFNCVIALLYARRPDPEPGVTAIGVELSQTRQRPDEINDLAWFEHSGIDPKHIRALEFTNYDEESIAFLRSHRIQRYKVIQFPSQLIKHWQSIGRDQDVICLTADPIFGLQTFGAIAKLAQSLVAWNEKGWLRFQATKYACRTVFWRSVYDFLGIRILWSMFDVDDDKLTKAQAIEFLGGLNAGGHWSNFPMYRVDNQKCVDVIMAWGEHFIKNNFQYSPYMAVFLVGYPLDYYFKLREEGAAAIRQRHEGKFIISYHDNIMANDLPYSKGMQLEVHEMLLSLLKKFENVVVLLKPKRRFVIDEIFAELPELAFYLKEGRLEVFLGETPRTKAVPAEIGMASDLVIGLGISTTATEAYLAGTVAFHADFTRFERNEFGNRGLGVIVFRDIFTLENAVIDRIKKKNTWSHQDYRGYYMSIEPFQDGCAFKRTGFLLKRIREYLAQGVDRQSLLAKVKCDYDVYLASMDRILGMSLN